LSKHQASRFPQFTGPNQSPLHATGLRAKLSLPIQIRRLSELIKNGYSYTCWPWKAQEPAKSDPRVTGIIQVDFRESGESVEDSALHGVDED